MTKDEEVMLEQTYCPAAERLPAPVPRDAAGETDADERDFVAAEADPMGYGWDGCHVEDALRYARRFRRERDEARNEIAALRARCSALEEESARLREALRLVNERRAWSPYKDDWRVKADGGVLMFPSLEAAIACLTLDSRPLLAAARAGAGTATTEG